MLNAVHRERFIVFARSDRGRHPIGMHYVSDKFHCLFIDGRLFVWRTVHTVRIQNPAHSQAEKFLARRSFSGRPRSRTRPAVNPTHLKPNQNSETANSPFYLYK